MLELSARPLNFEGSTEYKGHTKDYYGDTKDDGHRSRWKGLLQASVTALAQQHPPSLECQQSQALPLELDPLSLGGQTKHTRQLSTLPVSHIDLFISK